MWYTTLTFKEEVKEMGLYKRGKYWWVKIKRKDYEFIGSTGCTDKKSAEIIYSEKLNQANMQKNPVLRKLNDPTLEDVVEQYIKFRGRMDSWKVHDKYVLKKFLVQWGHLKLSEITPQLLEEFKEERLKKVSYSTIRRQFTVLQSIFSFAKRKKLWMHESPFQFLERDPKGVHNNGRVRWLTKEEFKRLIDEIQCEKLRDICMLAISTGLRKGEIRNISVTTDFDPKKATLFLETTKNGDQIYINLPFVAVSILQKYNIKRPFDYDWRKTFERAVDRAKLKDVTFHTLRHTFASWLVQAGTPLYTVQKLMRHKSIKMTTRYSHLAPEATVEASEKMVTNLLQSPEFMEGIEKGKDSKIIDITEDTSGGRYRTRTCDLYHVNDKSVIDVSPLN